MHTSLRRVALAVTLPLAVGAPVVVVASPAHAVSDLHLTISDEAPVYGQPLTATAEVLDGSNAVTEGCVRFDVSLAGEESAMSEPVMSVTVPLDDDGRATTPLIRADGTGLPLEPNEAPDTWRVDASYYTEYIDGCTIPMSIFADVQFDVARASSSIAVLPTASTLVADIVGLNPGGTIDGSLRPGGGAVTFKVDGVLVGANDAVDGRATLDYALPKGTHTVEATYSGDPRYKPGSSQSGATRKDPILEARVISTLPRSRSGWYSTAVEIWWVCKPQGSELVEECPADVVLKKSGKRQSVTRTVTALDGGTATLTVSGIDIDRDKPVIRVEGRTCTATDRLSGVKGGCKMRIAADGSYTAVATDKAGNRKVKRGRIG